MVRERERERVKLMPARNRTKKLEQDEAEVFKEMTKQRCAVL